MIFKSMNKKHSWQRVLTLLFKIIPLYLAPLFLKFCPSPLFYHVSFANQSELPTITFGMDEMIGAPVNKGVCQSEHFLVAVYGVICGIIESSINENLYHTNLCLKYNFSL